MVATTEQETFTPGLTVVATESLEPTKVQPLPVTANVTAPVPEPPVVANVIPVVPLAMVDVFELEIVRVACKAREKTKLLVAEVATR